MLKIILLALVFGAIGGTIARLLLQVLYYGIYKVLKSYSSSERYPKGDGF